MGNTDFYLLQFLNPGSFRFERTELSCPLSLVRPAERVHGAEGDVC